MSSQLQRVDGVDLDEGQCWLRLRKNLLDLAEEVKDTDEVEFYLSNLSIFDRRQEVQEEESCDELSRTHPRRSTLLYAVIAVMLILLLSVLVCAALQFWCCNTLIGSGGYSGILYEENEEPVGVAVTFWGLAVLYRGQDSPS